MKRWTIVTVGDDTTNGGTTLADVRLKIAEHIIKQYVFDGNLDVRNILTETKVGARRRPALLQKLKIVFAST